MTTKRMAKLKECVLHLANSITKYSEYLDTQNKRMMEIHNLPHSVRTPGDGISTSLRHIPGSIRSQNLVEKYSDIEQQLQMKFEFDPVCVNDFAPADRQRRYHYIQDISMPFNVTMYSYCGGGPKEYLQFIWKCGSVLDIQQANKVIHIKENSIDVYHTRAMRKEFHEKFGLISKAHPAVFNEMYRYLTNDSTVPQSKCVQKSAQSSTCSNR